VLGIAAAAVLWLVAPAVGRFFENAAAVSVLRSLSPMLFFVSCGIVGESILQRELRFKQLMWADIGSYGLVYAPVGVTMAMLDYGVWALVAASVSQTFARSLTLIVISRHPCWPALSWVELRHLLGFGSGVTLVRLFNYLTQQADFAIVGRWLGTAALGAYQLAFAGMNLQGRYLGSVLDKVLFPAMAKIQRQADRLGEVYLRGIGVVGLVTAPMSSLLIIAAPELVPTALGPGWESVVVPFQIFLLQAPLRGCVRISDALMGALGAVYRIAARRAVYALVFVAACLAGVRWDLAGVAVGVTIAVLFNFAIMALLGLRAVNRTWLELGAALVPGISIAAIAVLSGGGAAVLLRSCAAPPVVVLGATGLAATLAVGAAVLVFPRLLGASGLWLVMETSSLFERENRLLAYLARGIRQRDQ
jgi:PST family polysaccharide transporter